MGWRSANRPVGAAVWRLRRAGTLLALLAALLGGGCGGASAPPSPTAPRITPDRPSTSPGPEAAIKEACRAWLRARIHSAVTGDAKPVIALTAPDSEARGNAGDDAESGQATGSVAVVTSLAIEEDSWHVTFIGNEAAASFSYSLTGHHAAWPSLKALGPDVVIRKRTQRAAVTFIGNRWLISRDG